MLWEIREYPLSALTYEEQVIHTWTQRGLLKIKLQAPGFPLWKIQVSSKVSRESLILCFPVIISVDYPNFLATKFKPSLHQVVLW